MDSTQSVVSSFKTSLVTKTDNRSLCTVAQSLNGAGEKVMESVAVNSMGVLEVYIHQARDIHNICIYQKQDVYAKFCLTSNPENSVSTKIVNGGGRNPVFDENLRLSVRTVESSLKCEIFMMSRVKNYLEDQLLGFTLVPLSDVIVKDGKLDSEFSLSSTDLFHSPAGFVHLSLSYSGASPEVMALHPVPRCVSTEQKSTAAVESIPSELDKIEFPDPNIVNENQKMLSAYFGISCSNMDSDAISEEVNQSSVEEIPPGEEEDSSQNSVHLPKRVSPPSSVSTDGISSPSSDSEASKAQNQDQAPNLATKKPEEADVISSSSQPKEAQVKPILNVNIEPEQKLVQQEFVDMYMKSMQQFTESLAKMKLPLDTESPTKSDSPTSDQKKQAPKSTGSRVFYGSRAFF